MKSLDIGGILRLVKVRGEMDNMEILYEDKYIVVCEKPVGILSEPFAREKNLPELLKKQTRAYKIDVIHRLDRNVGGVMVYSKSSKATEILSKMMAKHDFEKEYLAVVEGRIDGAGVMEDYLYKDKKNCKVYIVDKEYKDAKYAKLEYEAIAFKKGMSLVKVKLYTGRTHQIRVQFAKRGFYLLGDTKYGNQDSNDNGKTPIALFSFHLGFLHPISKVKLDYYKLPDIKGDFSLFKEELLCLEKRYLVSRNK